MKDKEQSVVMAAKCCVEFKGHAQVRGISPVFDISSNIVIFSLSFFYLQLWHDYLLLSVYFILWELLLDILYSVCW